MTTVHAPSKTVPVLPMAVGAACAGLALTLVGTYVSTPWRSPGPGTWGLDTGDRSVGELLLLIGFAAIGATAVFGVVARTLHGDAAAEAKYSLGLAVIAVLSIAVFWTGLPVILAAGAAVLALAARRRHEGRCRMTGIALGLSALVCILATFIAFTG
jgi:hypothetical protein